MAVTPQLQGSLSAGAKVGQELTLTVTENVPGTTIKLVYGVSDSQGNEWVATRLTSDGAVYTTVPTKAGRLTVTCTLLRSYDQAKAVPLVLTTDVASVVKLLPGQVAGKVVVGMSTDDYAKRVAETGPIGADHFFTGSWDPAAFIKGAQAAHARGLLPFGNMKTGDWGSAASGSLDASADKLAHDLAALGYPVHICLHHEPGFQSPDGSGEGGTGFEWRAMNMRLLPRIKSVAANVVTGVVDNGFKFSPKTSGQGWTDSELNQLYTDEFLACIDALGADYYDGATSATNGEPAAVKVARADSWMDGRGWKGGMSIGEFNFVKPQDATALFNTVKQKPERWWAILAFNSDNNNRSGIPTMGGGWNFTHDFSTSHDRLNAFKAMLADPLSSP